MRASGSFEGEYFSGRRLYGDDLDPEGVRRWFAAEEHGYYALAGSHRDYTYGYHALNRELGYRFLRPRYQVCVALGCAAGDDVLPLAGRVREFVALEPAERWWRGWIGATPARYLKPAVTGDIPLPAGSTDLVVALAVLHHIPNVSHVLDEVARVLCEGGHFVVREPISSMGDWRKPRRGLTANERGLPPAWLDDALQSRRFDCLARAFCCFPPLSRLAELAGLRAPYNHRSLVILDRFLCRVTSWNLHYHRTRAWQKFAPGALAYVLQKRAG